MPSISTEKNSVIKKYPMKINDKIIMSNSKNRLMLLPYNQIISSTNRSPTDDIGENNVNNNNNNNSNNQILLKDFLNLKLTETKNVSFHIL